jgi:Fic family protein
MMATDGFTQGTGSEWPAARRESRPWKQLSRAGSRADRTLSEITVTIPALLAPQTLVLTARQTTALESATRELTALDHSSGKVLRSLSLLLLRSESVASSKIEMLDATIDDYARALHGSKANSSAVAMVAATKALSVMIDGLPIGGAIDAEIILRAHHSLMSSDDDERTYAGQFRTMQNWVGGSDYSPIGALYIPPPPDLVVACIDDLVNFINRDDLPALAQAAIAHAQFETIHPFTDGNGRIGRALINSILRRRGATRHVVAPLATVLVAQRDRYFNALNAYRDGSLDPILDLMTMAAEVSTREAQATAMRLEAIPTEWADAVGKVRRDSTTARLLPMLLENPILSTEDVITLTGATPSRAYAAVERLALAGVLEPLTTRVRNQVWGARLVLDELDGLNNRIARLHS